MTGEEMNRIFRHNVTVTREKSTNDDSIVNRPIECSVLCKCWEGKEEERSKGRLDSLTA